LKAQNIADKDIFQTGCAGFGEERRRKFKGKFEMRNWNQHDSLPFVALHRWSNCLVLFKYPCMTPNELAKILGESRAMLTFPFFSLHLSISHFFFCVEILRGGLLLSQVLEWRYFQGNPSVPPRLDLVRTDYVERRLEKSHSLGTTTPTTRMLELCFDC
jgi:hypothetical protein